MTNRTVLAPYTVTILPYYGLALSPIELILGLTNVKYLTALCSLNLDKRNYEFQ